uniref:Uncharacterized protein LOC123618853 n=1 Tax=Camelus bactrianus TaxID=9837 RepID=A0A9W3GFI0_CAMBA|nr:uncharacterized protein LOC123618853 [Camelus bactrianus]
MRRRTTRQYSGSSLAEVIQSSGRLCPYQTQWRNQATRPNKGNPEELPMLPLPYVPPASAVPPQLPLLDGPPLPAPPLWPRALSWKSNRRKLYSALQATQPAATLWVPLQETQEPQLLNNDGSVQPGHSILYYQTFSTMDLLNWRHQTLLYSEKPQAMIDLLESIFQTHQPTWDDIQQLLLTLFNTKERKQIITETKKWLQEQAPEGTMYAEEWAQNAAPDTRPE